MGVFDGLPAEIATALSDAGVNGSLSYTQVGTPTRNLTTGVTTSSDTTKTLAAVIGACKRELRQGVGVEAGDLRATIMAPVWDAAFSSVPPALKDKVTHRSRGYAVAAVASNEIGAALVNYTLQLRRS